MTFEEILDQAIALLQRRERLTYRALKRQFDLDDAFLDDLKEELIYGQQLAVDEDGKVLVWTGAIGRASTTSPAADFAPATTTQRAPLSYTPSHLTEKILDARPRLEGERKQVTVLFADIKDSTELIRELDPEAAQQLLDPALRRMMAAVHRYEGTVNQVLGDGIMALFGAPIAHEDHALRACYAGLAMQAAMREYTEEVRRTQGLELRIRVGLNSGEVVVRAIGNDLHMDYSAVGQTTHLAARMEQLAAPGSIRLSASTLRLVEGLVRVSSLGLIPVKGLLEPVEVYELVGASAVQRRLQAAMARSAYREAVGYFEQAIGPLRHLPETRHTCEQAIDLRLALRSALLPAADAGRILMYLRQAEALAVAIDDHRRLGHISGFLSVHFRNMGAYDESIASAQRALALATDSGDEVVRALANLYLGAACWAQGDYRRAIACLSQTLAGLDETRRRERLGQANVPSVQSLAFLAACHAELGLFAEGSALGEEGLQIAETVAHPSSLMWASSGLGLLSLRQGTLPRAIPLLERAMSICVDADLPLFVPRVAAALGSAYILDRRSAEAVPLLTQAMNQTTAQDLAGFEALCSLPLAAAYLGDGRLEEAQAIGERALALSREHQERGNQAYALHLLGDIAAPGQSPPGPAAKTHYQEALALAEALGMRPLQAHCHLSLGLLYLQHDKTHQASPKLSAASSLYRAMGMMLWLPQVEGRSTS